MPLVPTVLRSVSSLVSSVGSLEGSKKTRDAHFHLIRLISAMAAEDLTHSVWLQRENLDTPTPAPQHMKEHRHASRPT